MHNKDTVSLPYDTIFAHVLLATKASEVAYEKNY